MSEPECLCVTWILCPVGDRSGNFTAAVCMQFCTSKPRITAGGRAGVAGLCFNCGAPGHRAADCPMLKQSAPGGAGAFPFRMGAPEPHMGMSAMRGMPQADTNNEPCLKCGLRGHRSVECPSGRQVRALPRTPCHCSVCEASACRFVPETLLKEMHGGVKLSVCFWWDRVVAVRGNACCVCGSRGSEVGWLNCLERLQRQGYRCRGCWRSTIECVRHESGMCAIDGLCICCRKQQHVMHTVPTQCPRARRAEAVAVRCRQTLEAK